MINTFDSKPQSEHQYEVPDTWDKFAENWIKYEDTFIRDMEVEAQIIEANTVNGVWHGPWVQVMHQGKSPEVRHYAVLRPGIAAGLLNTISLNLIGHDDFNSIVLNNPDITIREMNKHIRALVAKGILAEITPSCKFVELRGFFKLPDKFSFDLEEEKVYSVTIPRERNIPTNVPMRLLGPNNKNLGRVVVNEIIPISGSTILEFTVLKLSKIREA